MTRYEELVALRQSRRLVTGISYDLNNAGAGLRGYVHFFECKEEDIRRHQYTHRVKSQAEVCRV